MRIIFRRLPALPLAAALLGAALCLGPDPAAAESGNLRQAISEAQTNREAGQAGLNRLTARERQVNADLAAAEDRIMGLERDLAEKEAQLEILETARSDNLRAYDVLNAAKETAEQELLALLAFLWPVHNLQENVGARDGALWSQAEREYTWTAELVRAIGEKQAQLRSHEASLSENLAQRQVLAHELRRQVDAVRADKDALLADSLKFTQELADIRQEKQDLESTLANIQQTINRLNVELELSVAQEAAAAEAARAEAARAEAARAAEAAAAAQAEAGQTRPPRPPDPPVQTVAAAESAAASDSGGTAGITKGKMPWPAKGQVKVKYAPNANPPVRGIGIALAGNAPVKAVAWGKVVHSGVLRGLGYVLVLMHPKQYYTVYAHLAGSDFKVGQEVRQGETIGLAGHYPAVGGPGLYFELRSHEKAVNPETWLVKN